MFQYRSVDTEGSQTEIPDTLVVFFWYGLCPRLFTRVRDDMYPRHHRYISPPPTLFHKDLELIKDFRERQWVLYMTEHLSRGITSTQIAVGKCDNIFTENPLWFTWPDHISVKIRR